MVFGALKVPDVVDFTVVLPDCDCCCRDDVTGRIILLFVDLLVVVVDPDEASRGVVELTNVANGRGNGGICGNDDAVTNVEGVGALELSIASLVEEVSHRVYGTA